MTKLPDHDMRPKLTDLTVEARESGRSMGTLHDLEGGMQMGSINKKKVEVHYYPEEEEKE